VQLSPLIDCFLILSFYILTGIINLSITGDLHYFDLDLYPSGDDCGELLSVCSNSYYSSIGLPKAVYLQF
jgi:hypothetical protein